jgi:hypothetical protein
MSKNYQNDPELIRDVAKKTDKIERAYQDKQAKKRQRKVEKEELEQRWVAPLVLIVTLVIGFLVMVIFGKN